MSFNQSCRLRILTEVAIFVILAVVMKRLLDPVIWRFSGPVSLITLLGILSIYFRQTGQSWRDYGLIRMDKRRDWLLLLPRAALTFVFFAIAVAGVMAIINGLDLTDLRDVPDKVDKRWGDVEGNLGKYLLWLAIVWTAAAFGEEMFFRGYLVTRLRTAFGDGRLAGLLAILLAAAFFGYGHFYYQGWRGLLMTGAIGIAFGSAFLLFRKNLYPIILLHGIIDTLAFTALYFGWED